MRISNLLLVLLLSACATSPLGRSQLKFMPNAQITQMGVAAYSQMKQKIPLSEDSRTTRYVRCVANAIVAELDAPNLPKSWEINIFQDDSANAFALPGGKIGVHTGLLKVATNQDQLAAVLGHEVAHVIAEHSNERVSTQFVAQTGMQIAGILATVSGKASSSQQAQLMALLGLGAQYGVILPFGRTQESEADLLGLDYMAKAGFNPQESVTLWLNMAKAAGGKAPPEFLSTHPSSNTRINQLKGRMDRAIALTQKARSMGKRPNCRR